MTRILIADDNPSTRSALVLLLNTRLGVFEIDSSADWTSLLDLAHSRQPAAVLLDWELPGCPAAEGLAALRAAIPQGKIIALSARPEARQAALQAGADAFIGKSDPPGRVLEVLQFLQRSEQ
jgi:two-component system response regulator DesR